MFAAGLAETPGQDPGVGLDEDQFRAELSGREGAQRGRQAGEARAVMAGLNTDGDLPGQTPVGAGKLLDQGAQQAGGQVINRTVLPAPDRPLTMIRRGAFSGMPQPPLAISASCRRAKRSVAL